MDGRIMFKFLNVSPYDLDSTLAAIVPWSFGWKLSLKSVASFTNRIQARVDDRNRHKSVKLMRSPSAV